MSESSVKIFRNPTPKTLFSPKFQYVIYESNISDMFDMKNAAYVILSKEKEVISSYPYIDDWGTALGENSMTSRADAINLLKWEEFSELGKVIRECHSDLLKKIDCYNYENLYVQCWANVLRKGQRIAQHQHWRTPYSYLGGHISVQTTGTETSYVNPITKEVYHSTNDNGKITLFENWIEHYTSEHNSDEERITIAFDIITETVYAEDIFPLKKSHWVQI